MAPGPARQSPTFTPLRETLATRVLPIIILCTLFFILGLYSSNYYYYFNSALLFHDQDETDQDPNCLQLRNNSTTLQYFQYCSTNLTNYCPCHDARRERKFHDEKSFHRERHCPVPSEAIRCLVPRPVGYQRPFPWPVSREYAWFSNVPSTKLSVSKKVQNWVRLEGDRLFFPGGGTSFPMGAKGYIDQMKQIVPLDSGNIRTVLDVGCGVASFGASLLDYEILTMSIAPRDVHEAQVQFALERGLPAMLAVLSTHRLPYPSRSFDMAHCSRCLVKWTRYDGLYLLEIDRVLRPGGYWVLSGPPINWKFNYIGWQRSAQDLENEQKSLEDLARRLCWTKVNEKGPIAVWQKPINHVQCAEDIEAWSSPKFCADTDPDAGWYRKMDGCITPLPKVADVHHMSGAALEKWPERLNTAPPRIIGATIEGTAITIRSFNEDNRLWKRRVVYYGTLLKSLFAGKYRNVMDMNAGLGGFAAALADYPLWVMNVVPLDAKNSNISLGIVYERGLIGTYMNWCEPFSTYPRTYDLIHADGLFSMYMDKCDILDILFEMYRILRPEGAIIVRDHVDIIMKVRAITDRMRWTPKIFHSEHDPSHPEKILLVDGSN